MLSPYSPDACNSGGVLSSSKLLIINASSIEASIYEKNMVLMAIISKIYS
jgi:hypothetical protein